MRQIKYGTVKWFYCIQCQLFMVSCESRGHYGSSLTLTDNKCNNSHGKINIHNSESLKFKFHRSEANHEQKETRTTIWYSPIYLLTTLYVFTEINLGMVASHISEILLDGAWLVLWILIRVRGGRLTEMFRVKEIVLLHCLLSLQ